MQHAQARGEKSQIHNQQDMEMAHRLVPRLEGVSKGAGSTE
jgi:hypothetical protein